MLTDLELSKLRWRCRRGFLENDIILTRLLDRRGANFAPDEHEQLLALISLDDNDLWEIIAGRSDDFPAGCNGMVETLRQTRVNH
ncbi:MAG TPA: succinate dehydrogenase assembly factor 2 [Casimicrobium huifangae]|jgi:antitoxin CptB|uniref:FAD assembly factor SdhE n=1 Tax=Casimicrobium huifangae TaxID=2591109 RepID=UPI0012EC814C|nr:succinate dehydrogenase assembly factor 2 [Casimicrobium huifangae]HOB02107.1 succinate dehydrogenase assembly factor 2 [Casimicrobium huifangae]HQA32749.1 succinate dehydrogenase assembly factor 2 [Casimicrobium huifangae]HQD65490.1 succinate dehydrogenase assembly factor 2 [Casimicrobium huifangae]